MTAAAQVRLDLVLKGTETIGKTIAGARAEIGRAADGVAKFGAQQEEVFQRGESAWEKLTGSIGGAVGKIGGLTGALGMAKQAWQWVDEWRESMQGAEENLRALSSFSDTFGGQLGKLDTLAQDAGYALDQMDLVKKANQAALFGISIDQVGLALRVASDIGDKTGQSFDQLYKTILNTASGASESADRFNKLTGATLDLKRETERYAASLGKTAAELTETEKRAAAASATFEYLRENMDPGINEQQAQGWHRLNRAVEDTTDRFKMMAATVTGQVINSGFNLLDSVLGRTTERIAGLDAKVIANIRSAKELAGALGYNRDQAQLLSEAYVTLDMKLGASAFRFLDLAEGVARATSAMREGEKAAKRANDAWADAAQDLQKEWRDALGKIKEADDYFQEENRKAFEDAARKREAAAKAAGAKAAAERKRQAEEERREAERNADYGLQQFMRGQEQLTRMKWERWEDEKRRQEEAAAEALRIQEELAAQERELELQRRMNLEQTIYGLQAMDSQLGAVRGSLQRTLRATATIVRGITLHLDGIIKGQAGSISALGAITASVLENQRAQAAVMALAATGEGFYALARHDYPAAGNAFAAAAVFGAVAGTAPSGGGGSMAGAGSGMAGPAPSLAAAGPSQGGNTTLIVNGFVGSPVQLAASLAGMQDRSREANLVRPRGV